VRLAQPLDLRVFLHVQIRCTCMALPPRRCPMLPWAFCSAHTVLEDLLRRDHLRRDGRSTSGSGSAASPASRSGATRGRRDAGHRAPRSVAGRRRGPEGKEGEAESPSEDGDPETQPPQQESAAGVLRCSPNRGPRHHRQGRHQPERGPTGPEGRTSGGEPSPDRSTSAKSRGGRPAGSAEHVSHVKERFGSASR
jgi:hypothetical protein